LILRLIFISLLKYFIYYNALVKFILLYGDLLSQT